MDKKPSKSITIDIEKWKEEYVIIINEEKLYCEDFDIMTYSHTLKGGVSKE